MTVDEALVLWVIDRGIHGGVFVTAVGSQSTIYRALVTLHQASASLQQIDKLLTYHPRLGWVLTGAAKERIKELGNDS